MCHVYHRQSQYHVHGDVGGVHVWNEGIDCNGHCASHQGTFDMHGPCAVFCALWLNYEHWGSVFNVVDDGHRVCAHHRHSSHHLLWLLLFILIIADPFLFSSIPFTWSHWFLMPCRCIACRAIVSSRSPQCYRLPTTLCVPDQRWGERMSQAQWQGFDSCFYNTSFCTIIGQILTCSSPSLPGRVL